MKITNAEILVDPSQDVWTDTLETRDDGTIGPSTDNVEFDWGGDLVVPGFIDLHTDALESRLMPHPSVNWPSTAAILAHDRELVAAGVTTVYNAVSIGNSSRKPERLELVRPFVDAVQIGQKHPSCRADHKLHLRCEITDPLMPVYLQDLLSQVIPDAMSIMDHAPGQRQTKKMALDEYASWMATHYGSSKEEAFAALDDLLTESKDHGATRAELVARLAKQYDVALATHDDETAEHVNFAHSLGIDYCEFPVHIDAAERTKALGLSSVMGAPNVVRGGSSGGNISASELIHADLACALVSDFVPSSQLFSLGHLLKVESLGFAKAISLLTTGPAKVAKLADRGTLTAGKRADILRLSMIDNHPIVKSVICKGQLIAF